MAVWFNPNHMIEFLDVRTIFLEQLFEDCFMAEFIVVNNSLERGKRKSKINNK